MQRENREGRTTEERSGVLLEGARACGRRWAG